MSMKNWNSTSGRPTRQPGPRVSAGSKPSEPNRDDSSVEESDSSEQATMSSPDEDPKKTFYKNLRAWLKIEAECGRTWPQATLHHIEGRTFELWHLYQTVLEHASCVDDVKWEVVAEKMGYEEASLTHAPEQLEGCWDKYLSNFHDSTSGFNYSEFGSAEDPGLTEEEEEEEEEEDDPFEDGEASTPQRQRPSKHLHPAEDSNPSTGKEGNVLEDGHTPIPQMNQPSPSLTDSIHPASSHRKRRLDRDVEIPASPQTKLNSGPKHGTSNTDSSKRRRVLGDRGGRWTGSDMGGGNATLAHGVSGLREASRPSPLAARPRVRDDSSTPRSSATGENTRHTARSVSSAAEEDRRRGASPGPSTTKNMAHRVDSTSRSNRSRIHTQEADATLKSNTQRERSSRINGTPIQISSSHRAPRRHALPPAIAPNAKPASAVPPLANNDDGDEPDAEDSRKELQATVNQFMQQGYSPEMAIESLYRTSLDPSPAKTVLLSLKRGSGVPKDQAGVWTNEDDDKLRSVDSGKLNQPTQNITEQKRREDLWKQLNYLTRKHGAENIEARKRFLADAKEAGFAL